MDTQPRPDKHNISSMSSVEEVFDLADYIRTTFLLLYYFTQHSVDEVIVNEWVSGKFQDESECVDYCLLSFVCFRSVLMQLCGIWRTNHSWVLLISSCQVSMYALRSWSLLTNMDFQNSSNLL